LEVLSTENVTNENLIQNIKTCLVLALEHRQQTFQSKEEAFKNLLDYLKELMSFKFISEYESFQDEPQQAYNSSSQLFW
jgi:hypothetical protein